MTVLSVAYPFAPVGRDAVGGSEQILSILDHALVSSGHMSLVAAHHDSQVAGTLFPTEVPEGTLTNEIRSAVTARHQRSIECALESFAVDVIHFHGLDFRSYRVDPRIASLATLHLPLHWYPLETWAGRGAAGPRLQCVSHSQRNSMPDLGEDLLVIENGVFEPKDGDRPLRPVHRFAVALGRICPEKNFHLAFDAGTEAGVPVLLGGKVFPYAEHELYFRDEIEPRLKHGHRFLGPLNGLRKKRMLAAAQCLLLPSLAPETSSLVAMEALSAGAPVIAFPSGALREIVEDGLTGFLVTNQREMARAIGRAHQIDRKLCRERARERFDRRSFRAGHLFAGPPMTQLKGNLEKCSE